MLVLSKLTTLGTVEENKVSIDFNIINLKSINITIILGWNYTTKWTKLNYTFYIMKLKSH